MVRMYERVRTIRTGRFGSTFIVSDSGRHFVMKTVDTGRLSSSERTSLLGELTELAQFRHPHIVAMRECFFVDSIVCTVSEHARGGDLAGCIAKARRNAEGLAEPLILHWFAEACLGLKHLHDLHRLHCDLRARRVLLSATGHVLLSGLATSLMLARLFDPEDKPDLEAMRYLAPELLVGQPKYSNASDMWALGVLLYELITLRPPFADGHPYRLAERIHAGPIPAFPEHASPELQELCTVVLQHEPTKRPSVADVLRTPVLQRRLVALFSQEQSQLPEYHVGRGHSALRPTDPGTVPLAKLLEQRPAGKEALSVREAFPGAFSKGPLTPRMRSNTPRSLQRLGESYMRSPAGSGGARTTLQELRGPSAFWWGASSIDKSAVTAKS